jgi:hypothetical protein
MTAGRVVSPDLSPEREKTLTKGRAAMVKIGLKLRKEIMDVQLYCGSTLFFRDTTRLIGRNEIRAQSEIQNRRF